ncbi:MAG: dienelactone hydrolase family protein [Parvularculales bacterium]
MSTPLSGPRLPPTASGPPGRLVILCHGYGADGNDLISLGPHWQKLMPDAAFVAPNAPQPCAMGGTGYQWFPITRTDPTETERGVTVATPVLEEFIKAELSHYQLTQDRLALVGFSQGTMMALHIGLRGDINPAAIVGFSGTLTGGETLGDTIKSRPPVLLVHGDADNMIPPTAMYSAAQTMGRVGLGVQWHISQGVGHGIGPDGLSLAGHFLSDAFAGRFKGMQSGEAVPDA